MTTGTYDRERELTEAITPAVESTLPGVEVLAVELLAGQFCVVRRPPGWGRFRAVRAGYAPA